MAPRKNKCGLNLWPSVRLAQGADEDEDEQENEGADEHEQGDEGVILRQ